MITAEQSNTSVRCGERAIWKLYRRFEDGINPDLEIGRHLTERRFPHVPRLLSAIEYYRERGEPATLAVLQSFVPNRDDAWDYTLESLRAYFARERPTPTVSDDTAEPEDRLSLLLDGSVPQQAEARLGPYLDSAQLLDRRTADCTRRWRHPLILTSRRNRFLPPTCGNVANRSCGRQARCSTCYASGGPISRTRCAERPTTSRSERTFVSLPGDMAWPPCLPRFVSAVRRFPLRASASHGPGLRDHRFRR